MTPDDFVHGVTPVRRDDLAGGLRPAFDGIDAFSSLILSRWRLRPYQLGPARAIVESVRFKQGRQLAVVFSRQSGKDELLAQVIAFFLSLYRRHGGSIVVAAPTFQPQATISRDRLAARLGTFFTAHDTRLRDGSIVEVGRASARFLSASPLANARGQTADLLLVANEAQDIKPEVWDAVFDPMAASTNATTLFLGTVWSRNTLLARQLRHLEELEAADGIRRVWRVPWQEVARTLPAYGERVRARMAQLGPSHPFIRTEYCLEELDGDGGLFPPQRLARLQGDHPRRHRAEPGKRYALLIDVAGEEEAGTGPLAFDDGRRRDSTAVTVVEIDQGDRGSRGTGGQSNDVAVPLPVCPPVPRPVYRVVDRLAWTGEKHTAVHARVVDLARSVWRASAVVVDATGIGAGLASFLAAALAERPAVTVVPFVFTAASKSALGWDLLALIEAGRLKEYGDDSANLTPEGRLTAVFWDQLRQTTYETLPGPGRLLRWSVPAARGHDDLVMSLALVSLLDRIDWRSRRAVGR